MKYVVGYLDEDLIEDFHLTLVQNCFEGSEDDGDLTRPLVDGFISWRKFPLTRTDHHSSTKGPWSPTVRDGVPPPLRAARVFHLESADIGRSGGVLPRLVGH